MCGIIFIVFGIIYLIRRFKLAKLRPEWFPDVPVDEFHRWKIFELVSIDIFLVATLGIGVIGLLIAVVVLAAMSTQPPAQQEVAGNILGMITAAQVALFVIGLILSAA